MLLLTRRLDEKIIIYNDATGEKVIVCVKALTNRQVLIGTAAPEHLLIDREEVFLRRLAEGDFCDERRIVSEF